MKASEMEQHSKTLQKEADDNILNNKREETKKGQEKARKKEKKKEKPEPAKKPR
jgi:hypothetical protein